MEGKGRQAAPVGLATDLQSQRAIYIIIMQLATLKHEQGLMDGYAGALKERRHS